MTDAVRLHSTERLGYMKIAVYAIAKNEEKFVKRWYDSMKEADGIFVCDTGSTDNTASELKALGVNVKVIDVKPWRFDDARNESLDFVDEDYDICVCTDLDEVFSKGWRDKLESIWNENATRGSYRYIWNFDENGNPKTTFNIEKIHLRHGFKWIHPVHEVLQYSGDKKDCTVIIDSITLSHYPDTTKSRAQYLPLLELSVKEDPEDDRNMHYLGREYLFNKEYEKAIKTLKQHLKLKSALWADERCASMRYIAKCYNALGRNEEAYKWHLRSIAEAPHLREPYIETAIFASEQSDWYLCIYCINEALKIKTKPISYINEGYCWDSTPYDLLSIAYYNTEQYLLAQKYAYLAYSKSNSDSRIAENIKIINEKIKSLRKN